MTHKQVSSSTHENHLFTTRFWKRDGLILGSFVIFSILNVILFARYGWLFGAQDLQFHLQRIEEVYQNLRHLNLLPAIATYTFNQNGSAVMSLYPKLPLYPFALCRLIIGQPIVSYYVGMILQSLVGMVICYYCLLTIDAKKRLFSYLATIGYVLSGMAVTYNFASADLGVSFSILCFPLAFVGVYHWLKSGNYKMLTIGVSLVALSHVLNFILLICMLICITIINLKKINQRKLINLLKGVGISTAVTSSFWLPALSFGTSTRIVTPQKFPLNGISWESFIKNPVTSASWYGISLLAIVGLILGLLTYRYLPKYLRQALWLSIGIILISSSLFPWEILQKTPLSMIQFSWRLLVFPQLFLMVIFGYTMVYWVQKLPVKWAMVGIGLTSLVIVGLSMQAQYRLVKFQVDAPEINYTLTSDQNIPYKKGMAWFKTTNVYEYRNLVGFTGNRDYYPKSITIPIFNQIAFPTHNALLDNNATTTPVKTRPGGNQATLTFNLTTPVRSIEMPFVIYNHHYQVTLDGKSTDLKISRRNLLTFNHLSAGRHTVHISYQNFLMTSTVILLSIFGLIMLIIPSKQHRPR